MRNWLSVVAGLVTGSLLSTFVLAQQSGGGGGTSTGGAGALASDTFVTNTVNADLPNSQALSTLATGVLKSTTGTGIVSIAVAGDLPGGPYCATSGCTITGSNGGVNFTWQMLAGDATGFGIKFDRSATGVPSAIRWSTGNTLKWVNGLDVSSDDFIVAFDPSISGDIIRIAAGGKVNIGNGVGSPSANSAELTVNSGTSALNSFVGLINNNGRLGFQITNTSAGANASAVMNLAADGAAGTLSAEMFSSGFSSPTNQGWVYTGGASTPLVLGTAGTARITISASTGQATYAKPFITGGSAPSVANVGANSCGTTAATVDATSNDNTVVITVGATSGTQCRIAFVTTAPNAWACAANDDTTTIAVRTTPVDTTHLDLLGAFVAGDKVTAICNAR